ncbi:DNA-directed RNA polymerase I subunit RPA49-like [Scleropages formosus]|uniref:DNA-directed RNA polymerase I subunit RPA49-like n=1 Tax=Scleropages formosus TaxID=113540 RepID=A0A0P7V7B2_SCLFO|nr:DNA-directed RNA polymerase I subunit RPA49-like [Scleropages formosus]
MAKRCVWRSCKEEKEGDNLIVVQFSNGNLSNTDAVSFSMYSSKDSENPRKKSRLIVAAETDRLSYVGNNFGTGSLRCNTLCNYYVGVLNKATKNMEVHSAQLFNMQPVIPGESTREDEPQKNASQSYRDKVDSLIEAFGTNKQKLISPVEYKALEVPAQKLTELSPDDLQKMEQDGSPRSVLVQLQTLPTEGERRHRQARCAWYLFQLIKLSQQKSNFNRKFSLEEGCPRVIANKLMKTFTAEVFSRGRIQHVVPASMRVKLAAYCLALLLHMGDQMADLTLLHRDLGMKEANDHVGSALTTSPPLLRCRIVEVAKAMGLKLSKQLTTAGGSLLEEHRMATLVLPLVRHEKPTMLRSRSPEARHLSCTAPCSSRLISAQQDVRFNSPQALQ